MKILLTHFDAFGEASINSSACAAELVRAPNGCELTVCELPTEYDRSVALLERLVDEHRPDALIMLGQAAGRPSLSIERIGINCDDASAPDNSGEIRRGNKIALDGADGYFAALPIDRMLQASRDANVPASISNSAGTYVCNHLLYSMLYNKNRTGAPEHVGFIHVPATPQQAAEKQMPSMDSQTAANGISAMLTVLK